MIIHLQYLGRLFFQKRANVPQIRIGMYFLFHIWCCKHTTVQKIFNDISISLPFLPHKDHPNKLNNQFNLRRMKKKLLSSQ